MEGRQQGVPELIEKACHVADAAGDRDDRVLFWQDNAELTKSPVAAEGPVPTPPELVAVALFPIALRVAAVGHLPRRRGADPVGVDPLSALPLPALQVKLPELGDVFSAQAQAIAAEVDSLGISVPTRPGDAQGSKEARL